MRPLRVLVALHLSQRAGQTKLAGIFASGKTDGWDMTLLRNSDEFSADVRERIRAGDFDGIISSTRPDAKILRSLETAPCPVAALDADPSALAVRKRNLVLIRNDADSIARTAIETFDRCGQYADYAYLPDPASSDWSKRREQSFKRILATRGVRLKVANGDMRHFLSSLKTPAAVLAANDDTAQKALTVALAIGRNVPAELSLLGIDNDTFVCETTRISLSSIEPDFTEEGRAAAILLDTMMRNKCAITQRHLDIGIRRIVLRESTRALPPARKLIERAERMIALHATDGLTPNEIALRLGVSRALLDLRFRQLKRETLQTQITNAKFAAVLTALGKSDIPIARIAPACGFRNPKSLGNLFRRRMGVSMSEWRQTHLAISWTLRRISSQEAACASGSPPEIVKPPPEFA